MRFATLAVALATLAVLVSGCSPIIGTDCRAPLVTCGRFCLDLRADPDHCGQCERACTGLTVCSAGSCIPASNDAGPADASRDTGTDAGADAATRDAGSADSASADGGPADTGPVDANIDAGPPTCGLGEIACSGACVPANTSVHCGSCATTCGATEVCDVGACAAACASSTSTTCSGECVETASDHEHCGGCTTACGAHQVCRAGACTGAGNGHLVVIGHDFTQRTTPMSTLLANAVMLGGAATTRVVAWQGAASAGSIAGTTAALTDGAGSRGFTIANVSSADRVPVMLASADALLVYAQSGASSAAVDSLGSTWRVALAAFLHRGGVVVVLDAPSLMNSGTNRLLAAANLFVATSISELLTPGLDAASGRASDAVLAGVTLPYTGMQHTVFFTSLDPDVVVNSFRGPVVWHRVIAP